MTADAPNWADRAPRAWVPPPAFLLRLGRYHGGRIAPGGVAERPIALVLKTSRANYPRGFESRPLRSGPPKSGLTTFPAASILNLFAGRRGHAGTGPARLPGPCPFVPIRRAPALIGAIPMK